MSLAGVRKALEAILGLSRSRAITALAEVALADLEGDEGSLPVNDTEAPRPLTNAERQARFRNARRNASNAEVTERNVTSNANPLALSSLSSSSDFKLSSEIPDGSSMSTGAGATPESNADPHESRTQPAANRARGTRVPVTDASEIRLEAFRIECGASAGHPEWPRFLDHWRAQPGQRGVKLDWGATWRNWVRRSGEFAPRQQTNLQPVPAQGRVWKVGQ